ncbi:MAG: universal stress protein [Magnetospirillum sp.]
MHVQLRDILVHLDSSPQSAERLALAVELAARDGARLVGLFARHGTPRRVGVVAIWPGEEYTQAAQLSRQHFAAATEKLAQAEWRDANRGGDGEIIDSVVRAAQLADLVILGQTLPEGHLVPADLPEQVMLNSGRPVLVVPYTGCPASLGHRPIIAWNASKESARAASDALHVLPADAEALVLLVLADGQEEDGEIVAHLRRHGLKAQTENAHAGGIGLMDLLLNRVTDLGADLLVMGGHAQYSVPLRTRGSGTRHILAHMTVPVLFSC